MFRTSLVATTVVALVVLTACDNATSDDMKARNAQAEADDKSGGVAEAKEKINRAQAEADEKIAAADAQFMKLREHYRHATTTNLMDLDRRVADLRTKASNANGETKVHLDARLHDIHTSRELFDRDYRALDSVAASTWDDARSRLDKEWTALKALVDNV
jgi:regulator of protease activity HflC (stomatin/prohibitin superfamily)